MGSYWFGATSAWVWRHVRLGLAPRPLGFGATSVWVWRHVRLGSTLRRLGVDRTMLHKSADASPTASTPLTRTRRC